MNFAFFLAFAAFRTPLSLWDTLSPRCVGRVRDCLVFSLVSGLPSPLSADGLPSLFEPFTGTTPLSDPSETCVRVLWLVAFSRRPVATAATGVSEVSRFSCMKFLSVPGVFDYAEPDRNLRLRSSPYCLPHTWTASAL